VFGFWFFIVSPGLRNSVFFIDNKLISNHCLLLNFHRNVSIEMNIYIFVLNLFADDLFIKRRNLFAYLNTAYR